MSRSKQTFAEPSPRKYRPYVWVLGLLMLLVLLVVVSSPRRREAPEELIGVWTTTEPNYRGRFLAIYSGVVRFGTGDGAVTTGFIKKVEEMSRGGERVYSLTYASGDGQQELSVSFEPATGFLRLRNQPKILWKKSES